MTQEGDKQGINFGDLFKGQKESKRIDPFKAAENNRELARRLDNREKAEREFGPNIGRALENYTNAVSSGANEDLVLEAEDAFAWAIAGAVARGRQEEKQQAFKAQLRASRAVTKHSHTEPRIK